MDWAVRIRDVRGEDWCDVIIVDIEALFCWWDLKDRQVVIGGGRELGIWYRIVWETSRNEEEDLSCTFWGRK